MIAPCKDCWDRREGCHVICSEYYLFKQGIKKVSEQKAREVRSTPELCRKTLKQIWKEMKGR